MVLVQVALVGPLEPVDRPERVDQVEHLEQLELLGLPEIRVQVGPAERLEPQEPRVSRVPPDKLEIPDQVGLLERLEAREHQDRRDYLDYRVQREP